MYLLISLPPIIILVLAVRFYYTFDLETQLIASFYSMQTEKWKRYSQDDVKEQIEDSLANRTKYHYSFCQYLRAKLVVLICCCCKQKCLSVRKRQHLHDQSIKRLS